MAGRRCLATNVHNRPCITDEHGVLIHSHSVDPFVRHQSEGSFELMWSFTGNSCSSSASDLAAERELLPRATTGGTPSSFTSRGNGPDDAAVDGKSHGDTGHG